MTSDDVRLCVPAPSTGGAREDFGESRRDVSTYFARGRMDLSFKLRTKQPTFPPTSHAFITWAFRACSIRNLWAGWPAGDSAGTDHVRCRTSLISALGLLNTERPPRDVLSESSAVQKILLHVLVRFPPGPEPVPLHCRRQKKALIRQ